MILKITPPSAVELSAKLLKAYTHLWSSMSACLIKKITPNFSNSFVAMNALDVYIRLHVFHVLDKENSSSQDKRHAFEMYSVTSESISRW